MKNEMVKMSEFATVKMKIAARKIFHVSHLVEAWKFFNLQMETFSLKFFEHPQKVWNIKTRKIFLFKISSKFLQIPSNFEHLLKCNEDFYLLISWNFPEKHFSLSLWHSFCLIFHFDAHRVYAYVSIINLMRLFIFFLLNFPKYLRNFFKFSMKLSQKCLSNFFR